MEGMVLQPLLLGRAVKLSGVAVVLAVAVGSVIAGITGALLAVPLLAMRNAGIRELISGNAQSDHITSSGVKACDGFSGANGNCVGIVGSAFPPADVPAYPDSGRRNGAGPNRVRSGPAHRRQ